MVVCEIMLIICASPISFTTTSRHPFGARSMAVDGDDQTVQTQHFGENEDQDHTDEQSRLLGSTTDTGVTDDTDGETGCQARETDGQTSAEMDEAPANITKVEHFVSRVFRWLIQRTGDKDSDDQTVDGNDTRHDNGNDGLHDQLRTHHRHGGNTGTGLGRTIGSAES
uniref:Uncharacterized protein n=1 Tax=Anopheles coluzzii TaxID=1518534 RepID=A0A8W7P8J1_ANOCL